MDIDQLTRAVNQTSHNVDMLVGALNVLLDRDQQRAEELRLQKLQTDQLRERDQQRAEELRLQKLQTDQLSEAINQTNHNVDMLVGAINPLLERDRERGEEFRLYQEELRQYKREIDQRFLENDQRFNVLLEELRFLIRRLDQNSP